MVGVAEVASNVPKWRAGWGISAGLAATTAGVAAVITNPAVTALVFISAASSIRRVAPADLSHRLRRKFFSTERSVVRWVEPALCFAVLPAAMTAAWGESGPNRMWSPWALLFTCCVAWWAWSIAQRCRDSGRRARWWPVWLVGAIVVGGFFVVGGPFRARWAYCQERLTQVVVGGGSSGLSGTGRFCWHDARQRSVNGQTRFYAIGGDVDPYDNHVDLDGNGFVYSPDRSIEHQDGITALRVLGGGWYYFESGSVDDGFWLDG
jgi:hypothetical protein